MLIADSSDNELVVEAGRMMMLIAKYLDCLDVSPLDGAAIAMIVATDLHTFAEHVFTDPLAP